MSWLRPAVVCIGASAVGGALLSYALGVLRLHSVHFVGWKIDRSRPEKQTSLGLVRIFPAISCALYFKICWFDDLVISPVTFISI